MNIRIGEKVKMYKKMNDGNGSKVKKPVDGTVVGINNHYVIIQHKHYKECYTKHDFKEAISPVGGE